MYVTFRRITLKTVFTDSCLLAFIKVTWLNNAQWLAIVIILYGFLKGKRFPFPVERAQVYLENLSQKQLEDLLANNDISISNFDPLRFLRAVVLTYNLNNTRQARTGYNVGSLST